MNTRYYLTRVSSLFFLNLFIMVFVLVSGVSGYCRPTMEFNLIYLSDGLVTSSTATNSNMGGNLGTYFPIDSKDMFMAGWEILYISTTRTTTTTESFTTMNIAPALRWVIGERENFNISVAYCLNAQATYNDGVDAKTLSGTSTFAQLSFTPAISDAWRGDLGLNYYAASFGKSVVSSTQTEVAYTKTMIYPTIGFKVHF